MNETNLNLQTTWGGFDSKVTNWYQPVPYIPLVEQYYYNNLNPWSSGSIEKAFKLVQKLLEKKLIKEPKTVKDFIELVNTLSEIL